MALTEQPRIFPEDVAFGRATGGLYGAGESVRQRPMGYSRMGGAGLLRTGGMYSSFLDAARRANEQLAVAQGARALAAEAARRKKRAVIEGMRAQAAANLGSSAFGIASDYIAKAKPWEGGGFVAPAGVGA